jgi:hypothetical protein
LSVSAADPRDDAEGEEGVFVSPSVGIKVFNRQAIGKKQGQRIWILCPFCCTVKRNRICGSFENILLNGFADCFLGGSKLSRYTEYIGVILLWFGGWISIRMGVDSFY